MVPMLGNFTEVKGKSARQPINSGCDYEIILAFQLMTKKQSKGKEIKMKRLLFFLICSFFLSFSLLACGTMVKTTLNDLNENPEKYRGKRVMVTTDLENIVNAPTPYVGKRIELSGYLKETNFGENNVWNFILKDKAGRSVRCYVKQYEEIDLTNHELALGLASMEDESVTVVGSLEKDQSINLEWVQVGSLVYSTYIPTWRYY